MATAKQAGQTAADMSEDEVDEAMDRGFKGERAYRIYSLMKLYKIHSDAATAMDAALIELSWQHAKMDKALADITAYVEAALAPIRESLNALVAAEQRQPEAAEQQQDDG